MLSVRIGEERDWRLFPDEGEVVRWPGACTRSYFPFGSQCQTSALFLNVFSRLWCKRAARLE
jgi:hypothetical protein